MKTARRPQKLSKETMDFALELLHRGCSCSMIAQILGISKQSCSSISRAYKAVEADDWDYVRKNLSHSANVINWALDRQGKIVPVINESVEESTETDCEFCFEEEPTLSEIKESLDNIARLLENIIKLWR